jgi:hypothetical protein
MLGSKFVGGVKTLPEFNKEIKAAIADSITPPFYPKRLFNINSAFNRVKRKRRDFGEPIRGCL